MPIEEKCPGVNGFGSCQAGGSQGRKSIENYFMKRAFAVVLFLLFMPAIQACDKSWSGKCVGVSDGDTIKVLHGGKPVKIRLYGIDCPERYQDFGQRAKQFTSEMVFGKVVKVQQVATDRYGRTVAWVFVDGNSLNKELVRVGLAWWYRSHAPKDKDLKRFEEKARKAKVGLWSQPHPVPPWKFRKGDH